MAAPCNGFSLKVSQLHIDALKQQRNWKWHHGNQTTFWYSLSGHQQQHHTSIVTDASYSHLPINAPIIKANVPPEFNCELHPGCGYLNYNVSRKWQDRITGELQSKFKNKCAPETKWSPQGRLWSPVRANNKIKRSRMRGREWHWQAVFNKETEDILCLEAL